MKIGKIAIAILGLILVIALIMYFTGPSEVYMERKITINAPVEKVYTKAANMKEFNDWSPWYPKDPSAKYTYEGPDSGVDARMNWESDSVNLGKGSMWTVEVKENELIDNRMDFGYGGEAHAKLLFEPKAGATEVTWTYEEKPGAISKIMYNFMDLETMVGPDYEQGLTNLKKSVE
ncbi:SRPBCC family protein [Fulvivirga ligni]|uniref:SRPBCC family protein n=1 Tax=Fulvivirga ligni TaxID=2904246 RepID=UPI001F336FE5|nr:SRPBCC family protein [Fulvivirga ligni]UII23464.1 SRPBCC family protein [Fulvivirga ligni]